MEGTTRARRGLAALTTVGVVALVAAGATSGHIERASYWPDPAPDTSINPPAGGAVPTPKSLASAVKKSKKKPVGTTRVVCQSYSLKRLKKSIKNARANGFDIRPTAHLSFSAKSAKS